MIVKDLLSQTKKNARWKIEKLKIHNQIMFPLLKRARIEILYLSHVT